jgi:hypothetical protein
MARTQKIPAAIGNAIIKCSLFVNEADCVVVIELVAVVVVAAVVDLGRQSA